MHLPRLFLLSLLLVACTSPKGRLSPAIPYAESQLTSITHLVDDDSTLILVLQTKNSGVIFLRNKLPDCHLIEIQQGRCHATRAMSRNDVDHLLYLCQHRKPSPFVPTTLNKNPAHGERLAIDQLTKRLLRVKASLSDPHAIHRPNSAASFSAPHTSPIQ